MQERLQELMGKIDKITTDASNANIFTKPLFVFKLGALGPTASYERAVNNLTDEELKKFNAYRESASKKITG